MNNVFFEIDSNYYVNVDHIVYVDFTDDDNLGDSLLTISLSNGSEYFLTLFELADDEFQLNHILDFLAYLKLYNLATDIGSYVHDLLIED